MRMVFPKFHNEVFETPEERLAASQLDFPERESMIANLLVPSKQFEEAQRALAHWARKHATGWIAGLLGESRSGKSFAGQYYASHFPPVEDEFGTTFPVAYIQARPDWSAHSFLTALYFATGNSAAPRSTDESIHIKGINRIRDFGVKLLVIEDAHLIWMGRADLQRKVEGMLIALSNMRACNIVLVGLPILKEKMEQNLQLERRGDFPMHHFVEYKSTGRLMVFLDELDKRLPFAKRSWLAKLYAPDFMTWSGGLTGRVMNLAQDAAFFALEDDAPCIDFEHLKKAVEIRLRLGQKSTVFLTRPEA